MSIERIARTIRGDGLLLMVLFILITLSGCGLTPQGDALRAAVQTKGADVYDEGLANAVWFKCRAASVGAIERRYMQNDETWELWTKECLGAGTIELPPDRLNGEVVEE